MKGQQPYVITIVGAESSGKSTLARQLADRYGCSLVPEYAREYLGSLARPYHEGDLEEIARGQLERIEAVVSGEWSEVSQQSTVNSWQSAVGSQQWSVDSQQWAVSSGQSTVSSQIPLDFDIRQRPILIVDGGMLTLRMWARIKYGKTIPLVEKALREDVTSLYLLCRPVLPWEPDPLREAPSLLDRVWIYNLYLKELTVTKKEFHIITMGLIVKIIRADHK